MYSNTDKISLLMIAMLMKKKAGQRPTFQKVKNKAGSKFLS